MQRPSRLLFPALSFLMVFCSDPDKEKSTFQVIQSKILQPSCTAGCHSAGTAFATESGLVLDAASAYSQLTGKSPKNAAALRDGLQMVPTSGGTGALEISFLWQKIDTGHDHAEEHPDYGQPMPLGREPLTNGELEFIRQWIVAGAPETGVVASETILSDTSRNRQSATFQPLDPPANGFQIKLGPFDIAPGFEREFNYFQPAPHSDTVFVNRVEISMRPGSHHFILYSFSLVTPSSQLPQPMVFRDLRNPNGTLNFDVINQMAFHQFFAGTQWPKMDDVFPAGVALEWPAGQGLDLNSHYVNKGSSAIKGEVHINLHTIPAQDVVHRAKILNIGNQDITLPPLKTTTIEMVRSVNQPMNIFKMFSHAHQLLTEFKIIVVGGPRNGEVVYQTTDWQHPPILTLNPPLTLQAGHGLKLVATYRNHKNITVKFGLTSEDEMMILFGYYY